MRAAIVALSLMLLASPAAAVKKGIIDSGKKKLSYLSTTGPTDFTALDACKGAWMIYNTGDQSGAITDRCAGAGQDGANNFITTLSPTYVSTPPSGTAALQDAVSFSAGARFQVADSGAVFDSVNWAMGCWVNKTGGVNAEIIFRKGSASAITAGLFVDNQERMTGVNRATADSEQTAVSSFTTDVWEHVVVRYDAGVDQIETYKDGVKNCAGGCFVSTDRGNTAVDLGFFAEVGGFAPWTGLGMECFYMDPPPTEAQICEIALLGFDGTANGTARETLLSNACTCASTGKC